MKKIFLSVFILLCISSQSKAQLVPNKTFVGGFIGATMYTTYGGGSSFRFGTEFGQNVNTDIAMLGNVGAIMEKYYKYYELTVNVRAFIPGNSTVKFFGEVGGGAYIFKYSSPYSYGSSSSETYAGINFGMGGKVDLDKNVDLIVKGKFHNPFIKGGSFNWINLTAGINVTL